jgi:4-amino-4-deoxy-L-arabinose transferase-like glycosyltransferase
VSIRTAAICLVVVVALCLITGIAGIDFGYHWDETKILHSVGRAFYTGVYLPRWYNYPSLSYTIALVALAPEILEAFTSPDPRGLPATIRISQAALTESFKRRLRIVFLACTLPAVFWTFLLVEKWRGDASEALVAAILLGTSWELMYHARWIAPDALMMQLGALSMLLMMGAFKSASRALEWLAGASIAAGLCCGTKYPGGILMVPLLLALSISRTRDAGSRKSWRYEAGVLVFLFAAAFVISTPGSVLDPAKFLQDVRYESAHYGSALGEGLGDPLPVRAALAVEYLALALFSRAWPLALVFFLLAIAGAIDMARKERRLAVWFLSAPVLYMAFFLLQRLMIVRNFLFLFPFLAVCAARGWAVGVRQAKRSALRLALVAAAAALVAFNAGWLVVSSLGIARRAEISYPSDLAKHIARHPTARFKLTPAADRLLRQSSTPHPPNVVDRLAGADRLIFVSSEIAGKDAHSSVRLLANRLGLYDVVSGPYEVNLDYYPFWVEPHVLAIDSGTAQREGFPDR